MSASDFEHRLGSALTVEIEDRALQRLDRMLAARLTRRRRPNVRGWRIAAAVGVLAIAAPLAAIATAGSRYTETPFGLSDAAGFQAEIDAAKQAVPLPAGVQWPSYVDVQDHEGGYSRGGGRFQVEGVAFCLWLGSWLDATRAADVAAANAARRTLLAVPTWVLYTSPFADQSYRDVLDKITAGVQANDPSGAEFQGASAAACP
ncbi:MAG: hypothetical protein ACXWZ8_11115 [Gaiellaceae bacterium]